MSAVLALRPEAGRTRLQAAILGAIIAVTQFGAYGELAVAAGCGAPFSPAISWSRRLAVVAWPRC
jgi:hypothetical protein